MANEGDAKSLIVWQDKDVRFDVPQNQLGLRTGETIIDEIEDVEDTKGNNGEHGVLHITSLRLIWISSKSPKTNISAGFNIVVNVSMKAATSRLRGSTQAVFVHTKQGKVRFEFIFTNLVSSNPRLYTSIFSVFQAYNQSRLYRELKLRGSVVKEKQLLILPEEQICSKTDGVWNLSSDQGNLGTFFVTNVRVVWFANLAETFNVSIPYMQIKSVRVRESKFGVALVIETTQQQPQQGQKPDQEKQQSQAQNGAGFVLGFKVDPPEILQKVAREIYNLHQLFSKNPIFGVTANLPQKTGEIESSSLGKINEESDNVINISDTSSSSLVQYYQDPSKNSDRDPVYSLELGLAIEQLRDGVTVQSLWAVS